MEMLRKIDQKEALTLLRGNMDPTLDEYCWFKCHSDYLIANGRVYIYEINLNQSDIGRLIADDNRGDKNKISEYTEKMKKDGYFPNSYIFLRDLNTNEKGSYYVEDGAHRTQALQKCIVEKNSLENIKAILFTREEDLADQLIGK